MYDDTGSGWPATGWPAAGWPAAGWPAAGAPGGTLTVRAALALVPDLDPAVLRLLDAGAVLSLASGIGQAAQDEPGELPGSEHRQEPGDLLGVLLGMAPGAALAATLEDASNASRRGALSEADAISAAVAAQKLGAWAESRRMAMLQYVYHRRRLAAGDLPQAQADDLAGRSTVAEAAAACGSTESAIGHRLGVGLELNRLPRTRQALDEGLIDWSKVQAITDAVRPLDDEQALAVEARVLPGAQQNTAGQVRARLRRAVLSLDPAGAERRHQLAKKTRGVTCRPIEDGMGEMTCRLTAVEMLQLRDNLDALARDAQGPGDTRTLNQRRADVLVELFTMAAAGRFPVVANGSAAEPSGPNVNVTVRLETLMGHDQEPGDLHGYGPIPPSVARDLATRGAWRCVVVDDQHTTIFGMGQTTFTPAYRPPAATARFVRQRDLTCTFPGCRRQSEHCDLDHRQPHSRGGATCMCNLQPLCRHHHRLKHEAGFTVHPSDDPDDPPDTLIWTTPTQRRIRRYPTGTDPAPF